MPPSTSPHAEKIRLINAAENHPTADWSFFLAATPSPPPQYHPATSSLSFHAIILKTQGDEEDLGLLFLQIQPRGI